MINNRICYLYSTNLDLVTIHKHCQCQLDSLDMWYMLEDVLEGMLGDVLVDMLGDKLEVSLCVVDMLCGGDMCVGDVLLGNVGG